MPVFLPFAAPSGMSRFRPAAPFLQGVSLVLLDDDLHIVRFADIRCVGTDRVAALNDAVLNNGIIPNIHVI